MTWIERIAIVGLGRMGGASAGQLDGSGLTVTGSTRSGRIVEGIAPGADLGGRMIVETGTVVPEILIEGADPPDCLHLAQMCDLVRPWRGRSDRRPRRNPEKT